MGKEAKDIVYFLNEAFKLDPEWVEALMSQRPYCNDEIANHPAIIVGDANEFTEDGKWAVTKKNRKPSTGKYRGGFIGLLNGYLWNRENFSGLISTVHDDDNGSLKGFRVLQPKSKGKPKVDPNG